MRTITTHRGRPGLMMIAAGIAMALANIAPAGAEPQITLPPGTVIPAKLGQSVSSRNNPPGDTFTPAVKDDHYNTGLQAGTRIEGVIREAAPSEGGRPGVLDVDFRRIILPNGESRTITGSLYSLNGKDVERRNGSLMASSDKSNDRLKWIG